MKTSRLAHALHAHYATHDFDHGPSAQRIAVCLHGNTLQAEAGLSVPQYIQVLTCLWLSSFGMARSVQLDYLDSEGVPFFREVWQPLANVYQAEPGQLTLRLDTALGDHPLWGRLSRSGILVPSLVLT